MNTRFTRVRPAGANLRPRVRHPFQLLPRRFADFGRFIPAELTNFLHRIGKIEAFQNGFRKHLYHLLVTAPVSPVEQNVKGSPAASWPCAQMRSTQLANQDTRRTINKEQSFFYARTLPSRFRDLSLWARMPLAYSGADRLLSWLEDTLSKRVWSAMRDVLTIGSNYCNRV